MEKTQAIEAIQRVARAHPASAPKCDDTLDIWAEVLVDCDPDAVLRAVDMLVREVDTLPYGINLGAKLRNLTRPVVTRATVEQHLHRAMDLNRSPEGNPYGYLRQVSPRLLELAEAADLFARDLSTESAGFRVRDVAGQYLESAENERRGFRPPEVAPVSRQLPAPRGNLTDAEREANLARARSLSARFGKKLELGS